MKTQAGVQANVVGGQKQYGPMQWVGGTKGGTEEFMSLFIKPVNLAYQHADAADKQNRLF